MATTCKLIAQQTLSSATATVTFDSIPGTATDLLLVCSTRSARGTFFADDVRLRFNNNSTGYSDRVLQGNASQATSYANSGAAQITAAYSTTSVSTANTFASSSIYVPNYAGSANKSTSSESVVEHNSGTANETYIIASAGLWANTAAVTRIDLFGVANFATGSSFFLYAISRA
jgi:hypothetical protein